MIFKALITIASQDGGDEKMSLHDLGAPYRIVAAMRKLDLLAVGGSA
jgi:hypothetical protein